jgi:glycosyltransferase involved in cell wall biosynthesis
VRVLHLCCTSSFAGVERHVADLAASQAERGDEVVVVGGAVDRMTAAAADPRIRFEPYDGVASSLQLLRHLARPDVANVHMSTAEMVATLSPTLRGVPLVATRHFAAPRGSRRLTRPAVQLVARSVSRQIAVSRYVADHIDGTSVVVHSGVRARPDGMSAARRRRSVLVAQRLEPEKNTSLAIDAFAGSGLGAVGWVLEIAGDGSSSTALRRQASASVASSTIRFLGHRSDVDGLMASCGIYLATRGDEAYGLSVLEAMSAGAPVAAAAGGGHLETVGSVEGAALFAVGDAEGAASTLIALAEDEQRRDEYGTRLQQAQRSRFRLDQQAALTDAVYRGAS